MLLLADAAGSGDRRRDQRNISGMSQGELSISHILGTSDVPSERCDSVRGEPRTLASFAFNALQQICSEPWVRQRCLQCSDELCNTDELLLDSTISPRQAQRLLHLICYPDMPLPEDGLDPRTHIPRIMEGLDQWNLREAWLALTLQNKQLSGSAMTLPELQSWLDIVARAALDVFHLGDDGQDYISPHSATPSPAPGKSPRSGKKSQDQIAKTPPNSNGSNNSNNFSRNANVDNTDKSGKSHPSTAAWLVASLLEKLSPTVQGRVLRHAGNVLENTLWTKLPNKKKPVGEGGGSLQAHLPFLSLILTCLKGQDEQKDVLLTSLLSQFNQLLAHSKDPDLDGKTEVLRDALRLRLNLVGGLFDSIQRNVSATSEWAVVLTQLVTHSVVDLHNNSDVFPTIVDMVTALVHSTQITDNGERVEDTRKQNMNLMKKLKKELTDRNSESIKPLRQLLPFSKAQAEIIVTQPTSTIIDSKGNRVQSFEFVDKKPGLQVWEKQRVSPWELIEGQRNPAPLSWAWFGAVKMERKQLRYEEAHRLLKYHEHSLVKPYGHFLEPPPLPPEDVDVKPEIPIKEEIILKPDTPSSDQSPRGTPATGRKPKAPRKKRQTKAQQQAAAAAAATAAAQIQPVSQPPVPNTTPIRPGSPYGGAPPQIVSQTPSNYPPGPPPQWYAGSGQQSYYPAQPPGVRPGNQAKQGVHALQTLLRARQSHPTAGPPQSGPSQFQQFPQGTAPQRHQILRTQLRGQTSMTPMQNPSFPPNQGVMYSQQQMQQQALNQSYGYNPNQGGPQVGGQGGPPSTMNQGPNPQHGSMTQGPMTQGPMTQGPMTQGPMTQGPMTQGPMAQGSMSGGPFAGRGIPQRSFIPGGINGPGPTMNTMQANTNYRMNMGQVSGQSMNQMGQPGQNMNQMGGQQGQSMNQMGQPGQNMNQMGGQPGQSMNQMGQPGQNMNQMGGQPGQSMNQMGGQPGMPNMPHQNAQRFRQMIAMQQQQQQQQQQMTMGGPRGPMHFNPNQPSGY